MIPVKVRGNVGEIVSIELVSGEYGQQIEMTIFPPDSDTGFRLWFSPSDAAGSKWMEFVRTFNEALGREITSVEEMIGKTVEVVEVKKVLAFKEGGAKIEREVSFHHVVAVSEGGAQKKSNGKAGNKLSAKQAEVIWAKYLDLNRDLPALWEMLKKQSWASGFSAAMIENFITEKEAEEASFSDEEEIPW